MTRFVVVGCGAVGGTVGGLLALAGYDVVFAVRAALADDLRRTGLDLRLPTGRHRIRPDVANVERCRLRSDDVVLLTVQSQDTVSALSALFAAHNLDQPRSVLFCLQNGIDNERFARRFTSEVHGGCVSMASSRPEPSVVLAHAVPRAGAIVVGRSDGEVDAADVDLVAALEVSGIAARAENDVVRWKRAKLLRNLGNAVEIVSGPGTDHGALCDAIRAEGERTLAAAGLGWTSDDVFEAFPTPALSAVDVDGVAFVGNSTRQAVLRGANRVETDHLNGAIVELGRRHGVPTPVNLWIKDAVRARVSLTPRGDARPGRSDEQGGIPRTRTLTRPGPRSS